MLGDLRFHYDEDFSRTVVYLEQIPMNEWREFSESYLSLRIWMGRPGLD
jgi:hypothetical protein